MKSELTSTMTECITSGSSNKMTYVNSIAMENVEGTDIQFGIHNILDDYMPEILEVCKILVLSNEEILTYKYKPWLLSYHIYGTTDLQFLLLKLNNMTSDKEFTKKQIRFVPKKSLEIINKIYNAEKKYINLNRYKLEE